MYVAFRVDSSHEIGFGHISRCLNLANQLKEYGYKSIFIISDNGNSVADVIKKNNHLVKKLKIKKNKSHQNSNNFESWLKHSWQEDAILTIKKIKKFSIQALIVDHYALDYKWERKIRSLTDQIIVIDDLDNRKHDCNILVDHNYRPYNNNPYQQNLLRKSIKLIGLKYALIDPIYSKYKKKSHNKKIKNILVSFGGADKYSLTEIILDKFSDEYFNNFKIKIVIGINNVNEVNIRKKSRKLNNIEIYKAPKNLANLLFNSDLVVGALGTSLWERMCVGLPSIVIASGEDQKLFAKSLNKKGFIKLLGFADEIDGLDIKASIKKLFSKKYNTNDLVKFQKHVDGNGVKRVASEIDKILKFNLKSKLKLRHADQKDNDLLLHWANEPFVRANAFMPEPIEKKIHKKWFNSRLENPNSHKLYVASIENNPIGQVRLDLVDTKWHIDFSVDMDFRNQGLGTEMLNLAIQKNSNISSDECFIGQVKNTNKSSYNVFKKLNFNLVESKKDFSTFKINSRNARKTRKKDFLVIKNSLLVQNIVPCEFENYEGNLFQYKWIIDHSSNEILECRNAKHVLNEFPENIKINKKTHKSFIDDYNNLARLDFIISPKYGNEIIGALYVIVNNGELEMGKYIGNQKYLSKGVASAATSSFINFIKKYFPFHDLVAVTKKTNVNNIKLNTKKNFFIEKDLNNGFIKMRLKLR